MLQENRQLPDGYAELEYIQSTGTQKIVFPVNVQPGQYFGIEGYFIPIYENTSNISVFNNYPNEWDVASNFYSYNQDNGYITYTSQFGANALNGGWGGNVGEKTHMLLSTEGKLTQNG